MLRAISKLKSLCHGMLATTVLAISLLSGSNAAFAVTGPNNCSWILQPNDCLSTGTCACVKGNTTLTVKPSDTTTTVSSSQSTNAILNPACTQLTNNNGHDAVAFFAYADEWSKGFTASLFNNLKDAGLTAQDCDKYSYINANYTQCTAMCGGGKCTGNLITSGSQNWQCVQTDTSTSPATTSIVDQSFCIQAGKVPSSTYMFENDDPCGTGTWVPGSCSDTCGGGVILPPTCSGGDGVCDPATKPTSGQACNTQACAPKVCDPATITNGTVGAYPDCPITCDAGYNLVNGVCEPASCGVINVTWGNGVCNGQTVASPSGTTISIFSTTGQTDRDIIKYTCTRGVWSTNGGLCGDVCMTCGK